MPTSTRKPGSVSTSGNEELALPPHDTIFKAAELLHEVGAELEKLRAQAAILASRFEQDATSVLADTGATPGGESIAESVADCFVVPFLQDVRAADVRTAAGSGETVFSETAVFRIALHRSILPDWTRPDDLVCIRAIGDSMKPTLRDGDLLVLDRSHTEPALARCT